MENREMVRIGEWRMGKWLGLENRETGDWLNG
jgi:hypothetical protein